MKILGPAKVTQLSAENWARDHRATVAFVRAAALYWRLAPLCGVRPEVAYAQAAKETGWGKFPPPATLDPSFRNWAGLKEPAGGPDDDPAAHQRFPTDEVGIQAQLDHLALYAGAIGYPRKDTADPRHFGFLFGTAEPVEALGGRWAPDEDYGESIARLVDRMDRR